MPTWTMIGAGLLQAEAVVPPVVGSAGNLYVLLGYGGVAEDEFHELAKSTDGGATWSILTGIGLVTPPRHLSVFPRTPTTDVVFIAVTDTLYRSDDAGTTWTNLGTPFGPGSGVEWMQAVSATMIFAGTSTTISVSTDSGASFSTVTTGITDHAFSIAAAKVWANDEGSNPADFHRFNLDGSSVEAITGPASYSEPPMVAAVSDSIAFFFPNGNGTASDPLVKVVGTTPTDITPPGAMAEPCFWAASPDGTSIVAHFWDTDGLGGDIGQLWTSTDGGSTWTKTKEDQNLQTWNFTESGPTIVVSGTTWWAIGGASEADLFRAIPAKIWKSTDNGATWTATVISATEYDLRAIQIGGAP